MDIKAINSQFSVSAQIRPEDMSSLTRAGVRSLICNRPDGEGADQPSFSEIEQAAAEQGIETRYLPVQSGKVTDQDAAQFGNLLAELPPPVHAYCRTGMRSVTLWALDAGNRQLDLPTILETTKEAGYDMSGVAERIAGGGGGSH